MGLDDVYYRTPSTPASQSLEQMNTGLQSLGQVGIRQAQQRGMDLANQEAAYYQPGRQATGPEQQLGDFIRNMMADGPPEFQQRFHQELGQGPSLQAPRIAQHEPMQGRGLTSPAPMAQAQLASPQMPPSPPGYAMQPPQTTSQDMDAFTSTMRDLPTSTPNQTGMERLPSRPMARPAAAPVQQPSQPQAPTSRGPMTRGDVETMLRTAPFMKYGKSDPRAQIAADKLEWEKSKYAQYLKPHWDQLDRTKRDLAALAARVRMATSDTDRKANLELLKIKVQEMRIHSDMLKAQVGGLRGITQEGETNEMVAGAEQDLAQAEAELKALEKGVGQPGPSTRTRKTEREASTDRGPGTDTRIKIRRSGQPGYISNQSEFDPKTDQMGW